MSISEWILRNKKIVVIVWIAVLLLSIYPAIEYTKYISYSQETSLASNTQSAQVQKILSSQNNDTLIIVVEKNPNYENVSNVFALQDDLKKVPYVSSVDSIFNEYLKFMTAILKNETLAKNYIESNGIKNAPSFLRQGYVSNDNSTYLIFVRFNVSSDFRDKDGQYVSQKYYLNVKEVSQKYLSNFYITGQGAVAYEINQLTSSSGFAFGLIYVVLAIAVAITLYTYKASIITLLFVSLSTLIGYVGIFITGVFFGSVDYVVNYTLTAVLVGITTDYLVFILGRFREELRTGKNEEEAKRIAASKATKAVLISGMTVGLSLLTFSFVPGFLTWGVVLAISIFITVVLMVTFLPSLIALLGKKLLSRSSLRELKDESSFFYKTADFSVKRKFLVVLLIALLALPTIYFFFNLPTTYNFNTGLPQDLNSVKGLNLIEQKFGANFLYPVYVVVNANVNETQLKDIANYLLSIKGVSQGFGPYLVGNQITQNDISQFKINGHYYYVIYLDSDPYSSQAINTVKAIRENQALITGGITSSIIDIQEVNSFYYTELEIFITLAVAIVIAASFRSWKYPLISITGVFISISWSTTILYFISKYILGQDLIYLIPIIVFVILMSLGNDYSVFIISRVEEVINEGVKRGVPKALSRTGKIITSLGIILALSLGVLMLIPIGFLQQLGIAFLLSILIDTFIIRNFYFPAMIALLRGSKA